MGSFRRPVGPLPSAIYWRRRAVLLGLLAVLAIFAVLVINLGGGSENTADEGKNPAESITPGPTDDSSVIDNPPGGRDEDGGGSAGSGGSDDENGGGTGDSEGSDGSGGSDGGTSDGGGSGDGEDGGSAGGGGSDGGSGSAGGFGVGSDGVPAGSSMAACDAGDVELTLRSEERSYAPGERPVFELTAVNSGGEDCKLDFSPTSAVLTISTASGGESRWWASDDCPWTTDPILLAVPAGSEVSRTYEWDMRASEPGCATPKASTAGAGSYEAEVSADGFGTATAPFVLEKA
ncbi:hypothetical protein O7599_17840 [Streptomyces sp. WMMC500]|uniref:hypothetical protein n=1 Tax=Streptomyces sp. WMMC500 TaxID=3015154 RepID=UPI00248BFEFA|nr:hypothetical protein [Streptomyces sp. WMMC500]WBB64254.1 hypothetical protein O7599_17840 [Streptomyces sp. WMMC500]